MLGRGLKIGWQQCQSQGKVQRKQLSGWALVLHIGYTAVLSMLLVYAAFWMIRDQFRLPPGEGKMGVIWLTGLEIIGILAWNESLYAMGKKRLRRAGGLALLIVILLGGLWYAQKHAQELISGFQSIGKRCLEEWNRYFYLSPQTVSEGNADEVMAWGMLFLMGTALLQTVSALLRRRCVMLLFPTVVLAAEMSVGLTPGWCGIACMSAAGILSLYLDCHREFRIVPALVLAALLGLMLPVVGWVLPRQASRVNLMHDQLLSFQHRMEQEIRDFDWQALMRNEGYVDNHSIRYKQKEVIKLTVNAVPSSNLYLRGYYGTDYQRGAWDADPEAFRWACLRHGISSGKAAQLLAQLESEAYGMGDKLQYQLEYTGLHSSYLYLPYGADLGTAKEQYQLTGDFAAKKRRSLKTFRFEGRSQGLLMRDGSGDEETMLLCAWYNEYVLAHDLELPDNLEIVTELAEDLRQDTACKQALEMLEAEDAAERNAARLSLGSLVAGFLRERADYSLTPGKLPWGADPVEYFLEEGKEGYCTHFASAGIFLLRQLGVPARFASGYIVLPDQFRQEDGRYVASVKDEAAHAWVEIWLDDMGWVPVEMTPGYGEAVILQAGQEQQGIMPENMAAEPSAISDPQQAEVSASPGPLSENGEEPEPGKEEKKPEDMDGQAQQILSEKTGLPGTGMGESDSAEGGMGPQRENREGWGFAGEGGWAVFGQNGTLRVSHVIAGGVIALVAAGTVCGIAAGSKRSRIPGWQKKIRGSIVAGSNRKAVQAVNGRMYRQLKRKQAGIMGLRSDEEYLSVLKRRYPQISDADWERYIQTVRCAVYSQEEIGREDAELCYRLLEQVQSLKRRMKDHNSRNKRKMGLSEKWKNGNVKKP